jgi:hypothetical protein
MGGTGLGATSAGPLGVMRVIAHPVRFAVKRRALWGAPTRYPIRLEGTVDNQPEVAVGDVLVDVEGRGLFRWGTVQEVSGNRVVVKISATTFHSRISREIVDRTVLPHRRPGNVDLFIEALRKARSEGPGSSIGMIIESALAARGLRLQYIDDDDLTQAIVDNCERSK